MSTLFQVVQQLHHWLSFYRQEQFGRSAINNSKKVIEVWNNISKWYWFFGDLLLKAYVSRGSISLFGTCDRCACVHVMTVTVCVYLSVLCSVQSDYLFVKLGLFLCSASGESLCFWAFLHPVLSGCHSVLEWLLLYVAWPFWAGPFFFISPFFISSSSSDSSVSSLSDLSSSTDDCWVKTEQNHFFK